MLENLNILLDLFYYTIVGKSKKLSTDSKAIQTEEKIKFDHNAIPFKPAKKKRTKEDESLRESSDKKTTIKKTYAEIAAKLIEKEDIKRSRENKRKVYTWPKGKVYWLRLQKGPSEKSNIEDLKKVVADLTRLGFMIENWVPLSSGGLKFSLYNHMSFPDSISLNERIWYFWHPSKMPKATVIERVNKEKRDDLETLKAEFNQHLECLGINQGHFTLEKLKRKVNNTWVESSSIKVIGLNELTYNYLLQRKFVSLQYRVFPFRAFGYKRTESP